MKKTNKIRSKKASSGNKKKSSLALFRKEILSFVLKQTEAFVSRYVPEFKIPAYLAGFPVSANDAMPLAKLAAWLEKEGVSRIAGVPPRKAIAAILRQIDGPSMEVFNSFTLSEILLKYGSFEKNPLLDGFSEVEIKNVAEGCDSSHIRMQNGKDLGGRPNNYWGVLARCEYGRLQLGLTQDKKLFEECLGKVKEISFSNPEGFWDDHRDFAGRYDIYSADVLLFLQPLWALLREDALAKTKLDLMLQKIVGLGEALALEGGVSWAYGRTVNGHSQAMLMELMSMALAESLASDESRAFALVREGFKSLSASFRDGYVDMQRDKAIERYRSAWRIFETTVDVLGKFCYTSDQLSACDEANAALGKKPNALYPIQDRWISFDKKNAGIWTFRNKSMSFQLPVVAINDPASYLPFPHSPKIFENACDNFLLSGSARLLLEGRQYTTSGRPARVVKKPNSLQLIYDKWNCCDEVPYSGILIPFLPVKKSDKVFLRGERDVTFTVVGNRFVVEEKWRFDDLPSAIQLDIAEADQKFKIQWECESSFTQNIMPVEGLSDWRSVWGTVKHLHQCSIAPKNKIELRYSIVLK